MDVRRCLICAAIVGMCLRTATEPYDAPHVDPPQPRHIVAPTMTAASSTSRPAAVLDDGDPDVARQLTPPRTTFLPPLVTTSFPD